jgi:lycopene beta-cyclase
MTEVLIAGGGPAGWSLASACARRGLGVTLVAATRGWPATYGMWLDETAHLPPGARWVTARPRGESREYAVLDNESVLAAFAHPGIDVVTARVTAMTATRVRLTDGSELAGDVVFDATGVLGAAGRVEQTAYGVAVAGADVVPPGEAVFMDWRQPPGFGEPATFLYAVPLPDGRTLLEETCLARRPGLGFDELRDRLHARLGDRLGAVTPSGPTGTRSGPTGTKVPLVLPGAPRFQAYREAPTVERVRFPVDVPPPPRRARGAIPFGAAGGFVHPATGFSLGDTFRLAPVVADTIGRGARAVRRVLWPERARIVYRLRRRGLATLLSLTAAEHEEFFDLFFALPDPLRRAFLSGRTDVAGTAAAMAAMFRAAPTHLRRKMINP